MSRSPRGRNAFTGRAVAIVLGLAWAAAISACPVAAAAPRSGCETVHVGPEITPGSPPASYLTLRVKPGVVTRAALIAANPERHSCGVRLLPAYGKTALNSGDSYVVARAGRGCTATSCWLSGLPRTVVVPAGGRVRVPFSVSVAARTPSGQYLAGIVAGPSTPAAPPRLARANGMVGAAVVARVAIGVAVIVPGPLAPKLTIPAVTLDATPRAAVLNVTEQNGGNTWEHPQGQVLIRTAQRIHILAAQPPPTGPQRTMPGIKTFSIQSRTVLAGDSATLPLAVGAIPKGTWPTEVDLWYDHHRKVAIWRGQIRYPEPAADQTAAAPAAAGEDPTNAALPAWAKLLIAALAGLSAALGLFVLFLLRRRRRREA